MATPERVGRLVQQAEHLLHRRGGRGINLHDPQVVAARQRSLVVRCAVTGWDGVASVVLKHYTGDDARSFTDWASLAFLSSLEEASAVAPHFYAGDAQRRFVVMEDLGGAHSLADLLEQPDAAAVVAALAALATSMTRLVAATAGRADAGGRAGRRPRGGEPSALVPTLPRCTPRCQTLPRRGRADERLGDAADARIGRRGLGA